MALLSELVSLCEKHRVDSGATLTVFARRLREAGRVSKAGRGRGAAHMTYLDAARFLIACAATDHPEQAAEAELFFSNLELAGNDRSDPNFPLDNDAHRTLDLALAAFLEEISTPRLRDIEIKQHQEKYPNVPVIAPLIGWLTIWRRGVAALRVQMGHYSFQHPELARMVNTQDISAFRTVDPIIEKDSYPFRTGKNLSAELELPLLQAVSDLIAGNNQKKG
ncbi:hypothetical protein [Brucella pituitosa]|uniref:Uncharacterized protein n=1 Tax=Brucella pituitosa TaxID=571256 RepID=A0ABS3JU48_9HYPH|nr:hypothetical protein [Brucella pituitosa]MBO1038188.1 hypothetical protein [Brucella pituitosa]